MMCWGINIDPCFNNEQGVFCNQLADVARVVGGVDQRLDSGHNSIHQPAWAADPVLGVLRTAERMFHDL